MIHFSLLLLAAVFTLTSLPSCLCMTSILVRHGQSSDVPACPQGYTRLWRGYSYMGSIPIQGNGNGQDLSSPGSCLKRHFPQATTKCYNSNSCDSNDPTDFSGWLWSRSEANPSRCVVCEGPYNHIVLHSQTTTPPPCPKMWHSAWTGYSFVEGALHRAEIGSRIYSGGSAMDLGRSGSCLPHFESVPFIECRASTNACSRLTPGDKSYWLTTNVFDDEPQHGKKRYKTISRCQVCYK